MGRRPCARCYPRSVHIKDLSGKRVCVLGYGREGAATVNALRKYSPGAKIEIRDKNELAAGSWQLAAQKVITGENYLDDLDGFDVIIVSPGIPPSSQLQARSSKLTSATQIFLDSIADTGATVIGVTGSKGKSTMSSLIHAILQANGHASFLIGNIGRPALDYLHEANSNAIFVYEMSSYQLKDLTVSPPIAVITSFFPEHLDYHGSMEAYLDAKANITRHQKPGDSVFYNAESEGAVRIATLSAGQKIPYVPSDAPVTIVETRLLGMHNAQHIAGAWKVCKSLGASKEAAINAIKQFRSLPHRLENLGVHHDILWIDDAISTTPDSTIAALDALGESVETLILGGQDRGMDFTALAKRLMNSSVTNVILIGETGPRIADAIELTGDLHRKMETHTASSMRDVVDTAKRVTGKGKICLLSTGSPSYDMFKNFEEKGDEFKKWIVTTR